MNASIQFGDAAIVRFVDARRRSLKHRIWLRAAQRQAERRAQAAELVKQREDARRELRNLPKRIDALEAEQAKITSGTPKR